MNLVVVTWVASIVMSVFFIVMSFIWRKKAGESFANFAIAGGTLPFILILFTDIATIMGVGNFVGHSSKGYQVGLANIPFIVGEQGAKIIFALVFAGFAARFTYKSIAEMMNDLILRDKIARALVGLLTSAIMLSWVGGQAKGMGDLFSVFTGVDPVPMIIFFSCVFIAYTMIGGMYSVVWTDLIQGGLLIAIAIYIYIKIFGTVDYSFATLKTKLQEVDALSLAEFTLPFGEVFTLFITGIFGVLAAQVYWQRSFAAKRPKDASRAMLYSGIVAIVFTSLSSLAGIVIYAMYPDLDPNNAISWFILEEMTQFAILAFFILIYLAAISSASSLLHSASVVIINDLVMPNGKEKDDAYYVKIARLCVLIVGIFATAAALWAQTIIDLFSLAYTMTGGGVIPVLVIGLLWKRKKDAAFTMGVQNSGVSIWGSRLGLLSGAACSLAFGILWGVVISAIVTIVFSLILPTKRDPISSDKAESAV